MKENKNSDTEEKPQEETAPPKDSAKAKTKSIGHYIIGRKMLGEGTFGKVEQGIHILTGEKVS